MSLNRRCFLSRASALSMPAVLQVGCVEVPAAPLRIGINAWVGYDPLVLARDQGRIEADRLRIIDMFSNTDSLRALRNGLLDGAALTLDEALELADQGLPVAIVAAIDVSDGGNAVLARPDVEHARHLRGRRIGLERSSLGELMLDQLLQEGSLRPDEVELRAAEAAHHAELLRSSRIDAVITFEPMASQLQQAGFRRIFDSRQMPGEIIDVLVVRRDTAPERVLPLLQAWEQGRQVFSREPATAAGWLAASADLAEKDYLQTLQGLRLLSLHDSWALLARDARGHRPLVAQGRLMERTLIRLKRLSRPVDWGQLIDDRALGLWQARAVRPASA
ncbi:MAG: hypothetical protein RLZZ592_2066 [Pseudomonadota bacterium]|nr:NitT/TauT family transport system substrate-binding protein [Pseudomonadota bacterium]